MTGHSIWSGFPAGTLGIAKAFVREPWIESVCGQSPSPVKSEINSPRQEPWIVVPRLSGSPGMWDGRTRLRETLELQSSFPSKSGVARHFNSSTERNFSFKLISPCGVLDRGAISGIGMVRESSPWELEIL